ncbi:hypothetical protein ACODUL_09645 [Stenotrophomonas maltophilia]
MIALDDGWKFIQSERSTSFLPPNSVKNLLLTRTRMLSNEVVSLAASVGACASALAGFFTVREIAKQRQAAYRPEIVPSTMFFAAGKSPLVKSVLPDMWTEKLPEEITGIGAEARIPVINIGMGAARHAELRWDFDIAEAVRSANALAQESLSAIFFAFEGGRLSMKTADGGRSESMWVNQLVRRFDYILPASGSVAPVTVEVPHAYRQLIAAIVHFSFKKAGARFPSQLPELKLDIAYVDIAGSSHIAKYLLSMQLTMIAGEGESFQGYLESSRRK